MNLQKPYYAVIFTNTRTQGDHGYGEMAKEMEELARQQPGYLGFESARDELGISISYWESLEAISQWKANLDHSFAQKRGIEQWYSWYKVRVCLVEREYEFVKEK
ncbi:antibiotic biosynthesis monooxygenase family protein [Flagellimonas allohymeniacidonis]|uniref:Antibiotic biosynthesis monooxygenase n=1 Tax=Flagellimonas allohymeniacidonis TaxID=2517819 RepID=A0A4Q8QBK9_9FLAO|nr:antibiotic biosynthesis monooxygenase [Allomuricauda hymeniacidonis]TAI47752.1 antibiotic biosynthesis monooxygenase [Allomuricauda hymeniacidonis]